MKEEAGLKLLKYTDLSFLLSHLKGEISHFGRKPGQTAGLSQPSLGAGAGRQQQQGNLHPAHKSLRGWCYFIHSELELPGVGSQHGSNHPSRLALAPPCLGSLKCLCYHWTRKPLGMLLGGFLSLHSSCTLSQIQCVSKEGALSPRDHQGN